MKPCCAWTDGRDDLLNPNFNCGAEPGEPSCILDSLCTIHDGIIQEVKSIREHWWKPYIKSSIEKKLLRGHEDGSLLGILDTARQVLDVAKGMVTRNTVELCSARG